MIDFLILFGILYTAYNKINVFLIKRYVRKKKNYAVGNRPEGYAKEYILSKIKRI